VSDVQLASLALGNKLGDGGQGSVHELVGDPRRVYKQYHNPKDPSFCVESLEALIAVRDKLVLSGRPVDDWAAWPSAIVRSGNDPVGFIMPRVPADFTFDARGKSRLSELGVLAKKPGPLFDGITLPNRDERIAILRHLAGAVSTLHEHGIVIGDLSFANILWARTPTPRIMLIDCDGMRLQNRPAVLPQAETPDWDDPLDAGSAAPTFDRDCYKLALAVLRVLGQTIDSRPADFDPASLDGLESGVAQRIRQSIAGSMGPVGTRPTARSWVSALSERATRPVQPGLRRVVAAPSAKPELLGSQERKFRSVTPPKK